MNELKAANPQYDSPHIMSSHHSWLNNSYWNLEMLVWRRGETGAPWKSLLKQGSEPKTNAAHMKPGPGGNSVTCTYTVPPLHSFHDYFAS